MPVTPSRPVVGTSATKIAENAAEAYGSEERSTRVLVKNVTGSAAVFLGGAIGGTPTTGTGFQWDPADGAIEIVLEPGEQLWGIVATTPQTVHVLGEGR